MKLNKHTISNLEAEWLVNQFEGLLKRQLSRLQVNPKEAYYEDLLQEGRLILLQTASEFEVDWQEEVETYRFMKVVGKRFRWHCLDLFRKPSYKREIPADPIDYQLISAMDPRGIDFTFAIETSELWQTIYQELTQSEWDLLMALMDRGQQRQQIAKDFSMTRPQLYRQRSKLQAKIAPIYQGWQELAINER